MRFIGLRNDQVDGYTENINPIWVKVLGGTL